jgi:hypothetical protein
MVKIVIFYFTYKIKNDEKKNIFVKCEKVMDEIRIFFVWAKIFFRTKILKKIFESAH